MGAVSVDQRAPIGPLSAGAKLGRYEILCKLATGGMAIVYVGRVLSVAGFERLVALKVLHANLAHEDEFIHMFLDEARLAARIRHPNVVPTIDISDAEEAGYFIVMEYIEGDHLGALLSSSHKADERLPLPIALRIIADALGGLGAAHDLCDDTGKSVHLVHRDVSPHNIMVGRDGVVRLTDFGVAKAEDRLTHTRDGQVKGKLAYMAPEQAASGQTDSRSDLFSMGVILWECVTGQRLFRAENTAATLHKLLHDPIAPPSSHDPALAPLDPLLAKALHRDPAQRFQTAEEFAHAIEEVAPALGGLSSLRGVARLCKQYTAAKLKREKKLIDDALRTLRPPGEDGDLELAEIEEELSNPSLSEISVTSGTGEGLSASKISGVFSHDTIPGTRKLTPRRADEPANSVSHAAPALRSGAGSGLLAPPPAGYADALVDAERAEAGDLPVRAPRRRDADPTRAIVRRKERPVSGEMQAARRVRSDLDTLEMPAVSSRRSVSWIALVAVFGVLLFLLVRPSRERVRVEVIAPGQLAAPAVNAPAVNASALSAPAASAPVMRAALPSEAAAPRPAAPTNSARTVAQEAGSVRNSATTLASDSTPVRQVSKRDEAQASRVAAARRARRERAEQAAKNERNESSPRARMVGSVSDPMRSDVMPNPYHN